MNAAEASYNGGGYRISEGYIQDFQPAPYSGHKRESFTVNGRRYEYSDYAVTGCFHQTASHGAPLREGMAVRIYHDQGCILRLDAAVDQISSLPPLQQSDDRQPALDVYPLRLVMFLNWITLIWLPIFFYKWRETLARVTEKASDLPLWTPLAFRAIVSLLFISSAHQLLLSKLNPVMRWSLTLIAIALVGRYLKRWDDRRRGRRSSLAGFAQTPPPTSDEAK